MSYCKAEPELAVTTLARRNIPCSSSSFLIPRTWESKVCKSRSWRYLSLDPQMKSRSLRTCRRTNGVCWIIRYLGGETARSRTLELCLYQPRHPGVCELSPKTGESKTYSTKHVSSCFPSCHWSGSNKLKNSPKNPQN